MTTTSTTKKTTTMMMTTTRRKTKTRTTISTSTRHRGQRGVALILVLWTFAAVAVLAAEFARAMHDEAASTRNYKESTRARMVAIAGLNEVILAIQADRENSDRSLDEYEDAEDVDPVRSLSQGDGQWVQASFRGSIYEVRVLDEAGKLGLNAIDGTKLRLIFENLEIPDSDAETIADSILDWSDPDDLHQPNGAESEYYEGLDRPYRAKNAPFDSVEELLLVRGVTRDVFYGHDGVPGLRDLFSVFNKKAGVNPGSATPEVIQAITGLDRDVADEFSTSRRGSGGAAALDELASVLGAAGMGGRKAVPQQVTIEARVRDATGRAVLAHLGAVLNLSSSGDGLRLYRWYDSILDDSDQSGGTPDAADAAS